MRHATPRPSNGRRTRGRRGATPRKAFADRTPRQAPTPLASVANPSAAAATGGGGKNARPFQLGRNSTHHAMSARAAAVRLMWCAKPGTRHGQIDKPPKENAARTDHLTREGKHADQRQQLPLGAFLPRPPCGQVSSKPR